MAIILGRKGGGSGGGGGGSVNEITSTDNSVTITDPSGPTVDLSVSGGSQTLDEVLEETSPDNPAGSANDVTLAPGTSTGDTGATTTVSGGDATDDIGGNLIVTGGAGADSNRGGDVTVKAGDPGPTGDGRHATLRASDAGGDGDGDGGNAVVQAGAGNGAGESGSATLLAANGLTRIVATGDGDIDITVGNVNSRLAWVAHDESDVTQMAFFDKAEANTPASQPVVPLTTPDVQDVIDALVTLGLVSQSD